MAATSESLAADPGGVLVIERTFDAPRDLVFRCWSESQHFGRWIGPQGFTTTILTWEPRRGGSYRLHMRGPDGQEHGNRAFSSKLFHRSESCGRFVGRTRKDGQHSPRPC